jgi:hypothetical protein
MALLTQNNQLPDRQLRLAAIPWWHLDSTLRMFDGAKRAVAPPTRIAPVKSTRKAKGSARSVFKRCEEMEVPKTKYFDYLGRKRQSMKSQTEAETLQEWR